MPTRIQNEILALSGLANQIELLNPDTSEELGFFDYDAANTHYEMKALILRSNSLLNNGEKIPSEVTELIVNCLYNYLLKIGDEGAKESLLADSLYLSGNNTNKRAIEEPKLKEAFRKGFIEGEKNDNPTSRIAEDIKNRVSRYIKEGIEPSEFCRIEGRYLAEAGKKKIKAVDLTRVLDPFFKMKPREAVEYFDKCQHNKLSTPSVPKA